MKIRNPFQFSLRFLTLFFVALSVLTVLGVRRHQALTDHENDRLALMGWSLMHVPMTNHQRQTNFIENIKPLGEWDSAHFGYRIKLDDQIWIDVVSSRPTFPFYVYNGLEIYDRLDSDCRISMPEFNLIADQYPGMRRLENAP